MSDHPCRNGRDCLAPMFDIEIATNKDPVSGSIYECPHCGSTYECVAQDEDIWWAIKEIGPKNTQYSRLGR